jgi:hypothetical protein
MNTDKRRGREAEHFPSVFICGFFSLAFRRIRRRASGNISSGRRMGHNIFSNQPRRTGVLTVGSREARLSQLFAKEVRGQALRLAKG